MKKQFVALIALALAVAPLGCSKSPTAPDLSTSGGIESGPVPSEFRNAASNAINAGLDALVTPPIESLPVAAAVRPEVESASNRRNALAAHGISYKQHNTQISTEAFRLVGSTAKLTVLEHTILEVVSANSNAPEQTEYIQRHAFTFNKAGPVWAISGHQKLDGLRTEKLTDGDGTIPLGTPVTLLAHDPSSDARKVKPNSVQGYSLNRGAIVNYALKYAISRNPSYRSFGNDCTNFASQSVRAGGWTEVAGLYTRPDVWWYNWGNQSHTWINSNMWFQFTRNRPRGYIAANITQMQLGDIIQADWDRNGVIDHSMVVTGVDGGGTPWVSYHSNDTRHRSFWDLYYSDANRNANYYGWRLGNGGE